jgi:Fe-S-cluster containining protein
MGQVLETRSKATVRCQDECGARCCRYVTVQIPAPKNARDLDEISWWLAHHHVTVYVESRRWHLEVRTPCKYLTGDNLCGGYEQRPNVCRNYDPASCEFPARPLHTLEFDTREAFDGWREKKRKQQQVRRKQHTNAKAASARG